MKILPSFILLLLLSANAYAQSAPPRVLGTFVYNSKAYNYEFSKESMDNYSFYISELDDDRSKENQNKQAGAQDSKPNENSDAKKPKSVFSTFSKEAFTAVFADQMVKKYSLSLNNDLKDKATEVFFKIQARLDFIDDEPITAYFILKKDYINSFLKRHPGGYYNGRLSSLIARHYVKRVNVETEDGAIKNITVQVVDTTKAKREDKSPRSFLEFKNQFPISISGKFDPEKFANIDLFCMNCSGIKGLSRYIRMSDLVILDIVLENDKEDYSPSNRTIRVSPEKPITELQKEKRSRLIDIAAFTDFVGLDKEQPNGLIQIEAKRRININTKSHLLVKGKIDEDFASMMDFGEDSLLTADAVSNLDTSRYTLVYSKQAERFETEVNKKYTNYAIVKKLKLGQDTSKAVQTINVIKTIKIPNRPFRSPYYTFFSYVEPRLLFSKLEENRKFLPIDTSKITGKKIDPLRLFQHQTVSFGAQTNILRFNFPQLKFNWHVLNGGFYWFRTRIQNVSDSATDKSIPLNSSYWQIGSSIVFRPDSRWGANISFEYIKHGLWNQEYKLTEKNGIIQLGFDAYMRTSESSRLFYRFRWNHENHNSKNNFTQVQLGYSLSLFTGASDTPRQNQ